MSTDHEPITISRHRAIWALVPSLPAPRALVLLTVEELAQNGRPSGPVGSGPGPAQFPVDDDHPIETSEISSATGLSMAAAGNHLRALAEAGLVRRIYVLGTVDPKHPGRAPRALVRFLPELELGKGSSSTTRKASSK